MARTDPFKLKQVAVKLVTVPPLYSAEPVTTPEAAIRVMADELKDLDREVVAIVNFKTNMQPINFSIVSMGCLNGAIVKPRELLKNVFLSNANSIIMIHNHPSGSLNPSKEDIGITDQMAKLCSLAGIEFFDHIIIGAGNTQSYFSMKEKGMLPMETIRYTQNINALQWPKSVAAEPESNYEKKTSVLGELKEIQSDIQAIEKTKIHSKKLER